jgi:glycyl-tRNA synthetase beta chain
MNGNPEALDTIVPGYERVLAGRLDDAVFSFERDRERGLDDMASDDSLGAVVFHVKAGTLAQRRDRIVAIANNIASQLGVDNTAVATAARLAKADQVSYVVQEFAELEGFAGSLYARDAGHADDISTAIDQQFMPRSATASLPDNGVPAVIALADKIDLMTTMFAIGEQPSGSRDPHGLRRAAIGIMRIVLEHDVALDLAPIWSAAGATLTDQGFGTWSRETQQAVHDFVLDRVEKHLVDSGIRVDAVRAARGADLPLLQHLDVLARAMDEMANSDNLEFKGLLDGAKRCRNIIDKAGSDKVAASIDSSLFEVDVERNLSVIADDVRGKVAAFVDSRNFVEAVNVAAQLGPQLDAFFDRDTGVMVMADDDAVRGNRLALLSAVLEAVSPLGDFAELQVG